MPSKRPLMFLAEIVPPEEEPMKRIQHTLTATELLNLYANPITLLPSPGPGKRYCVFAIFTHYTFVTTPYTMNGNSRIYWPNTPNKQIVIYIPDILQETVNTTLATPMQESAIPNTDIVNQPLTLRINGPNELTAGDGTLLVVIYYTIEDTT